MPSQTSPLAQRLWELFFRNHVRYAVMSRNADGSVRYTPVEEPPTPSTVQQHLDREITIGAYSLDNASNVNLIAFDIDGNRESSRQKVENIATEIYRTLTEQHGITPVMEFSGNKGYHVLIFLSESLPAAAAKAWADRFADSLNLERRVTADPHVEIYPKQDILVGERIGNLLKLPLGLHLKTRSMSYLCDINLAELPDPLAVLQNTCSPSQLAMPTNLNSPMEVLVGLLGPRMGPGSRHQTFLNICGYLVRNFWTETDVLNLLEELDGQFGPFDLDNLREVVARTFRRYEADEPIVYSLQDLQFSDEELSALEEAVEFISSDPTLLTANKILMLKGRSALDKARALSDLIRKHMRHQGEYCRDEEGNLYWLKKSTGKLYSTRSGASWNDMLFSMVRYNQRDATFRMAEEDLRMSLLASAPQRDVKRLGYWDAASRQLYINLGGPWVYILDGTPGNRRAVYNGESMPVLFDNFEKTHNFPNLLESGIAPVDPWRVLLDDVSFSDLEAIAAAESKELLKVWILSVLFSSLMATRPLLSVLAAPGAGKTTLARRIVRLFEGPQAEVLSILADKPDSLRSQMVAHRVMCLDNLERSGSRWMADDLNRISTGAQLELRQLYTTNDRITYRPDVFVILTATEMPFTEETVFSRMLPVPLRKIANPRPESELQATMRDAMASLWLGMFDLLDEAILVLEANRNKPPISANRLADFTSFAGKLEGFTGVDWGVLRRALFNLTNSQQIVEAAHSPTIQLLQVFAQVEPAAASTWMSVDNLWRKLREVAVAQRPRMRYPASAEQVARDCSLMASQLEAIQYESRQEPGREMQYRFTGHASGASNGTVEASSGRVLTYTQRLPVEEL